MEKEEKQVNYPLLPYSQVVYEGLKHFSKDYTHTWQLRWQKGTVDVEHLHVALEKALRAHPVFEMRIDETGKQYREPSINLFVGPYQQLSIEDSDESVTLTAIFNRILGDAMSWIILGEDILRAYAGDDLQEDGYWEWLNTLGQYKETERYTNHRQILEQKFGIVDYPLAPQIDLKGGDGTDKTVDCDLEDMGIDIQAFTAKHHLSLNGLIVLATGLAIMDMEGTNKAGLTWAYNGRETIQEQRMFGSLHRDVPICLERAELTELIHQTRNKLREGIRLSDYPYTLTSPSDSPWHKAVNVLVEPSPQVLIDQSDNWFELSEIPEIDHVHLDVEVYEHPLRMRLCYNPACYSEQRIQLFAKQIKKNLLKILGEDEYA